MFLTLSLGYVIFAAFIIFLINFEMKQQALVEAASKARLLLNRNQATHEYITHQLKPALFQGSQAPRTPDYFAPVWMSSTYAIREIDKYFQKLSPIPYYAKESAIQARSPENEADPFEKSFLRELQNNPGLPERLGIRYAQGQPYFEILRRGEVMEPACLRCHSTPDQAPAGLVKVYGPERSFNRRVGEVVSAVSIRVPLAAAYAEANRFSLRISLFFLLCLGCLYLGQIIVNKNWVFDPLKAINDKAVEIATSPEHLGETIPLPRGRELAALATAFNDLSTHLGHVYRSLEDQVKERTLELYRLNVDLSQELEERQRMDAEIHRRNREITQINAMSASLQGCVTFAEANLVIAKSLQDIFPTCSGGLFMRSPGKNLMEGVVSWGEAWRGKEWFASDECLAVHRGAPVASGTAGSGVVCCQTSDAFDDRGLCLPLKARGKILGLLRLQFDCEAAADFTEERRLLAAGAADHIALALANLRLSESLRHQVMHDALTGLFNWRYLGETLERELHRVRRRKAPLGIIMLDLDYFKSFNDTYGHEAGDSLLRLLGKFLRNRVRKEDVACRYGGEEFVLILPEASQATTLQRAEDIRRRVPSLRVYIRGQELNAVSVSLGVAMFPDHGNSAADMLRAADNAMYRAKALGRNRVVLADGNGENDGCETSPRNASGQYLS
jgi:diguanylate cyclase (GGDEF)-like protein